jgi:lycopene cyclase domain-containing protein
MILLIPFFISNGILTGIHFYKYALINTSDIEITEAIVRYNNNFNLGIRIWSVPIEDFFYGLAMVLLTLTPYEYFRLKGKIKTQQ